MLLFASKTRLRRKLAGIEAEIQFNEKIIATGTVPMSFVEKTGRLIAKAARIRVALNEK